MNIPTKNIYCISGLGADERAFDRLNISGYSLHHLKWIPPLGNENLSSYANRMLGQIKESNPIILGLSFGGMIAIEMAKHIRVEKLILISTVKTYLEIPKWMRIAGTLRLHKILPIKANRLTQRADDRRMGIETIDEKMFVDQYRKNVDRKYVHWAVDQIITWENTWVPSNVFHIHGEYDRMFPLRNIQANYVVKNGTHIMILNKADEISACIEQILLA